jgi:hypothetical protein
MHSEIRLFHDRVNGEDGPIRVTHVEGTMAPRVGRQLLPPLDWHAFRSSVLSRTILDGTLHQDRVMGRAPPRCDPRRRHTRTGATGPGCEPPGESQQRCHERPGTRSAAPPERRRPSPHDWRSRSPQGHASSAPVFGSSSSHVQGAHGAAKPPTDANHQDSRGARRPSRPVSRRRSAARCSIPWSQG